MEKSPPPSYRYAKFDGINLRYLDIGQGNVPLVFVHGWGAQADIWRFQIRDLSKDHRVIALDLPGHGASGAISGPYTQKTLARAVLAVMDHARVKRAVLIGHSMGANVVRHAAIMNPKKVAGIVLVDGAIFFPPRDAKGLAAWKNEMQGFAKNFKGPNGDDYTRAFIDTLHGSDTPDWAKAEVRDRIMMTPSRVRVSSMTNFVKLSSWPQKQVKSPTLGVYARSPDVKPSLESDLRGLFPSLEYTLWDGPGHFFMLYEDDALNAEIRAFTQRHGF